MTPDAMMLSLALGKGLVYLAVAAAFATPIGILIGKYSAPRDVVGGAEAIVREASRSR